jgi:hypothetical protein
MNECRECDMAVYCYSDSSTWIFRTKQEMDEKLIIISKCPFHQQVQENRANAGKGVQTCG